MNMIVLIISFLIIEQTEFRLVLDFFLWGVRKALSPIESLNCVVFHELREISPNSYYFRRNTNSRQNTCGKVSEIQTLKYLYIYI